MTHRLNLTISAPELRDLHALQELTGSRSLEDTVKVAVRVLGRLGPALERRAQALLRYPDGQEEGVDLR